MIVYVTNTYFKTKNNVILYTCLILDLNLANNFIIINNYWISPKTNKFHPCILLQKVFVIFQAY